ncbi:hypothetical protein ARMSODRAFT_2404 [Armillaria solidipes]|uniref:Uncharacterized protein n=1 Tax=Armillaria solidipes TaxID=1076256 RepID=A0A2H3CEM8_9AGAR|nr:hypothetical protein ARMSODRAFT_2404 [Armillaria solidipes]
MPGCPLWPGDSAGSHLIVLLGIRWCDSTVSWLFYPIYLSMVYLLPALGAAALTWCVISAVLSSCALLTKYVSRDPTLRYATRTFAREGQGGCRCSLLYSTPIVISTQ